MAVLKQNKFPNDTLTAVEQLWRDRLDLKSRVSALEKKVDTKKSLSSIVDVIEENTFSASTVKALFSADAPIAYNPVQGRFSLNYNATNLKKTGSNLNTIQDIHTGASPTFAGLTLTAFAGAVMATAGVLSAGTLGVAMGGTGATTLTDHGILLGSGTGAITPLGEATNGQLPIGSTGADPVLATLTGTANQVTVTNGAGSITLSTPQDIHAGASPTFAGMTLTGFNGAISATLGVLAAGTLPVGYGGTGATTLTDHGLLVGSGVNAITPLAAATNGQLPIGSAGADPVLATLTGTANQVTVTNGAGTITLAGPQDLAAASSPTFTGLTVSGLTASRLVATNGASALASVANLQSWIAGTANQITVGDDGDGTITLSSPQDIATTSTPTFGGLTITDRFQLGPNSLPGSPVAGDIMVDSGDLNKLKWHDGTSWNTVLSTGQDFWDRASGHIYPQNAGDHIAMDADNAYFKVGAGRDAGIMYDGTNMIFDSQLSGTGHFHFKNGNVGMGTAPLLNQKLRVNYAATDSHSYDAIRGDMAQTIVVSGAYANSGGVFLAEGYYTGNLTGAGALRGLTVQAYAADGAGSCVLVEGGQFDYGVFSVGAHTGTVTDARGLRVRQMRFGDPGSTITNAYDLYILAPGGSGTAVTNDWCIYSAHIAPSRLVDDLRIQADSKYVKWGAGDDCGITWNATDMITDYDLLGSGTTDYRVQENGTDRFYILTGGNAYVATGDLYFPNDDKGVVFGGGNDMRVDYNGTVGQIDVSLVAPSDLDITCGANKTVELQNVVYDDINAGAQTISLLGLFTGPSAVNLLDNTGTGTGISAYGFSVGEAFSNCFEIEHKYAEGQDIVFHVHWVGQNSAPTGTDKVQWQLTYSICKPGSTTPPPTTITIEQDIDTRYKWYTTSFAAISGVALNIGDQFMFTLERIAASANEYSSDAVVATVGIHAPMNTMGSRQILSK